MGHTSHSSRREYLPGNLETSYKQLIEDFKDQELLEHFNLNGKEYSESKVFVDVQYFGWHEDNTVGEVTFRIYEEESQNMDTVSAQGIERRTVQEILDGKDVVENQIDNGLDSKYPSKSQTSLEAMD